MTVSYVGPSSEFKNSIVFSINGVDVTVARRSGQGQEFIRLNSDSAPLLEEMLNTLADRMKANEDISDFFRLGYISGLRLISACLHDEFIDYFKNQRPQHPHPNGKSQFDSFLNQIVGAKSAISYIHYFRKIPFLMELYEVFEKEPASLELFKSLPQYRSISGEFKIEFEGYTENHLHTIYTIDGHEVLYPCNNKTGSVSTQELFEDCVNVKNALLNRQNIKPFIQKYGGKCAYKILTIVGLDELLAYFKHVADASIADRLPLYPQKIIKEYGFSTALKSGEPFVLLDFLEKLAEDTFTRYMQTNDVEISRNDAWRLYYQEQGKPHLGQFNFTQFNNEIRNEILLFMRANYRNSTCSHLLRIYYCLCDAVVILGAPASILNCKLSDATSLRASLTANKSLSVATISEHLYYIAMFFDYIAISHNYTLQNPFRQVSVRSHTQYLNPTSPISPDKLKAILDKFNLMPMHIQIAVLILFETGARANEVCGVTIDEFSIEPDGVPVLKITLRKNRNSRVKNGTAPFVRHRISEYLANLIAHYITDHQNERSAIGTNQLLVYTPAQHRKGSSRSPIVLSSDSLYYWLKKVSGPEFKCTAREIRAEIGRAAFAEGKSASEVAAKLGNTAQIAEAHYNSMSAQNEAELYDRFYDKIFLFNAGAQDTRQTTSKSKELYGTCNNSDRSACNQNRCETCSQRITCKSLKKEGA